MSFDFSTLVTDRTQTDVTRVQELASKIRSGTASESELAEFNSAAMKGAYNYTDLNRVTAAMDVLKAKLEGYGYNVPGYQRIKINHKPPPVPSASRLPEGYLELAWIESTGTQYVDTGFKPNQNTRVVAKAICPVDGKANWLFGSRDSTSAGMYAFVARTGGFYSTYFGANVDSYDKSMNTSDTMTVDKNKAVTTLNGTSIAQAAATFQTSYSMTLFAVNTAGTVAYSDYIRVYSCQIYDNDTLIRDYIPCINPSGDVGLFDVVNKQFYRNAGTGAFMAGDRVGVVLPEGYTRLTHIESTGTQYIDSLYKPTSEKLRIVADFTWADVSSGKSVIAMQDSTRTDGKWLLWYMESNGKLRHYIGNTNGLNMAVTAGTNYLFDITADNGTLTAVRNGNTQTMAYSGTIPKSYSIAIFGNHANGKFLHLSSVKLRSTQIYDNDVLVRDFVPCINPNGEVGLYDLATAAFFGNAGTGSFIAGTVPRDLPDGYTQVECIQSSGAQYIDTGFMPNQDTRVVMDAYMTKESLPSFFFGSRNSSYNVNYGILVNSTGVRSTYNASTITMSGASVYQRALLDKNKNVCSINDVTVTNTEGTFQTEFNLFLFASNEFGTANYFGYISLYSCQIYDNGVLIRDFVPCKNSSGTVGLYDMVNGVFYQNAGSGTFTAGEEIAPPADAPAVEEYDPYLWYEFDWPTPETMATYLLNVSAIRAVLEVTDSTPNVPDDTVGLMVREANDIEVILLDVYKQINIMATTFIPCGEALCGGDNL